MLCLILLQARPVRIFCAWKPRTTGKDDGRDDKGVIKNVINCSECLRFEQRKEFALKSL